jgi:hypothetical protein
MGKDLRITAKQTVAINKVVEYLIDDERKHLEEYLFNEFDMDVSELTDDDLYDMKTENEDIVNDEPTQSHIWFSLYELSSVKLLKEIV